MQELENEPNMVSPASRIARNTFNFEFEKSPLNDENTLSARSRRPGEVRS